MGEGQRGYTLKDAAARLGISENALRKRIKKGQVPADLVPGVRGQEYRVWLDEPQASLASDGASLPAPTRDAQSALREAVTLAIGDSLASLQASLADAADADRKAATERFDELEARLAQLQASLASIAADRAEVARLRDENERLRRRPWWRFW